MRTEKKITAKAHAEEINQGQIFAPDGSVFFSLKGSETMYFTGESTLIKVF